MKTVSVVFPVYYNAGSLPELFAEMQKVEARLLERDCAMELIFVDDGSGDESLLELLKIKQQRPNTRIVKLTRNFGAVHASKVGLKHVTGDCTTVMNADLQDPPELVVDMTDRWLEGSKYVIGLRESRVDPLFTKIFAGTYHWLVKKLIVDDYPKGGIDTVLFDAELLPYVCASGKNTNHTLLVHWLGYQPATVSYDRLERQHGKSRWTFAKKLTYFIDSILGFSVLPIRIISAVGFVVSMLAFGFGGYIVLDAVFGQREVAGFATLVALITLLSGVMMIMLGIVGEYLWRVFDEITARPEAVIDEVF